MALLVNRDAKQSLNRKVRKRAKGGGVWVERYAVRSTDSWRTKMRSLRPRFHRARCFSRRGLVLFLIFYKSLGVGSKSRWSQILLAQNELGEDKWVKHENTTILKKCWNLRGFPLFSAKKSKSDFLWKNKLKMIPDTFFSPVFYSKRVFMLNASILYQNIKTYIESKTKI